MLVSTNESVSINVTGCKTDKSDTENLLVIKFDKKLSFDGHNIIGIKAKGRVSKRVFQENKSRQCVLCFLDIPVLRFALFSLLPAILSLSIKLRFPSKESHIFDNTKILDISSAHVPK